VETIRSIFWLVMKTLRLAFPGLVKAKAVAGLRSENPSGDSRQLQWLRSALYGAALVLAILGARSLGCDAAAGPPER
jgi:hypothetical protein